MEDKNVRLVASLPPRRPMDDELINYYHKEFGSLNRDELRGMVIFSASITDVVNRMKPMLDAMAFEAVVDLGLGATTLAIACAQLYFMRVEDYDWRIIRKHAKKKSDTLEPGRMVEHIQSLWKAFDKEKKK